MPKVNFNNSKGVVVESGAGVYIQDQDISYAGQKHGTVSFSWTVANAAGTEVDTGLDFPAGDILIRRVIVNVTTGAGGASINIGTLSTEGSGDADGLVDGAGAASANFHGPSYSNSHRGALFKNSGNGYWTGGLLPTATAARSISFTPVGDVTAGTVIIDYSVL